MATGLLNKLFLCFCFVSPFSNRPDYAYHWIPTNQRAGLASACPCHVLTPLWGMWMVHASCRMELQVCIWTHACSYTPQSNYAAVFMCWKAICVRGAEVNSCHSSSTVQLSLVLFDFRQGLSLAWSFPSRLGWPATETRDSTSLLPSSTGVTNAWNQACLDLFILHRF